MGSAGPSDPGSWNRYSYVEGDPVNNTDSSGLAIDPQVYDYDGPPIRVNVWGPTYLDPSAFGQILQRGQPKQNVIRTTQLQFWDKQAEVIGAQMQSAAAVFADQLRAGNSSENCSKLLANSKIDIGAWADSLEHTTVENGIGNTRSAADLFYPGTAEYTVAQHLTVCSVFGGQSGTSAVSSMTSYMVWIYPRKLANLDFAGAGALVAHEALHHLGLKDGAIQESLGLKGDPGNSFTISKALKDNCF